MSGVQRWSERNRLAVQYVVRGDQDRNRHEAAILFAACNMLGGRLDARELPRPCSVKSHTLHLLPR